MLKERTHTFFSCAIALILTILTFTECINWWIFFMGNPAKYFKIIEFLGNPNIIPIGITLISVVISLIIIYLYRSFGSPVNYNKLHNITVVALRFWLAYECSAYGFAKILKRQFAPIYYRLDMTFGSLSGYDLTWGYFAHSYRMSFIVALLQITGGLLLLFRRTTLLGVCAMMPVFVNIIFINLFYIHIFDATFNSVLITAGLGYLLLLKWDELKQIFLDFHGFQLFKYPYFKGLLKVMIIVVSFVTIYFRMEKKELNELSGKWKIEQLTRNNKLLDSNSWVTDKKNWKVVYLEGGGKMILSPNPYAYVSNDAVICKYVYDEKNTGVLKVVQGTADTAAIVVKKINDKKMLWNTVLMNDTLQMVLTRL